MNFSETIAAISTPVGEGGIGVIRISGPEALGIAGLIFKASDGRPPHDYSSHSVHHGWVCHPHTGERVDEALLLVMKSPRSYTGEDVIEIQGHGGQAVTGSILEMALLAGARVAEPGEFTRRAFLSGRIDLAQAESVIDLIRAKTDTARKSFFSQLSGALSKEVNQLKNNLMSLVAEVEVSMDHEEGEWEDLATTHLSDRIKGITAQLNALLEKSQQGILYQQGLKMVIAGRTNVGKSSLLNILLEKHRAIVTPHPGTTRDTVEGWLNLRGVPIRLVDCAGIRETECAIESEGIQRSVHQLMSSPLIILVVDSSEKLCPEDNAIFNMVKGKKVVIVLNKIDLPQNVLPSELRAIFSEESIIPVSCSLGSGIEELKECLYREATAGLDLSGGFSVTANVRHREIIRRAIELVSCSKRSTDEGLPLDAIASDLRLALEALGEITGETATEDILDAIFKNFCIGK